MKFYQRLVNVRVSVLRSGRSLAENSRLRNHINVLSSDVVVALPGSAGTGSEVALALSYQRSVFCYLESRNEIPGLPAEIPVCSNLEGVQEFVRARLRTIIGLY